MQNKSNKNHKKNNCQAVTINGPENNLANKLYFITTFYWFFWLHQIDVSKRERERENENSSGNKMLSFMQ